MSSRMERYSNVNNSKYNKRSEKNKSLYSQIEDLKAYTNIEGVATIEKTNEIDITKVKDMLRNRENYKKQKRFGGVMGEESIVEEPIKEEHYEQKNYDIKDILSKVKKDTEPKKDYKLTSEQYELLRNLKNREYDFEKEENEIKELLNTISSNKELNELKDANDVGLLDDLKSDTMVGDASSIKKIIEQEKEVEKTIEEPEIDKSFYTSSFGFTQRDFEELKNMNHTIKKSNKAIIVLLSTLIFIVLVVIVWIFVK